MDKLKFEKIWIIVHVGSEQVDFPDKLNLWFLIHTGKFG